MVCLGGGMGVGKRSSERSGQNVHHTLLVGGGWGRTQSERAQQYDCTLSSSTRHPVGSTRRPVSSGWVQMASSPGRQPGCTCTSQTCPSHPPTKAFSPTHAAAAHLQLSLCLLEQLGAARQQQRAQRRWQAPGAKQAQPVPQRRRALPTQQVRVLRQKLQDLRGCSAQVQASRAQR